MGAANCCLLYSVFRPLPVSCVAVSSFDSRVTISDQQVIVIVRRPFAMIRPDRGLDACVAAVYQSERPMPFPMTNTPLSARSLPLFVGHGFHIAQHHGPDHFSILFDDIGGIRLESCKKPK